jgi:hypothetical protein
MAKKALPKKTTKKAPAPVKGAPKLPKGLPPQFLPPGMA